MKYSKNSSNKVVSPHYGPSAVLVLVATGNNVVQDANGWPGYGIKKVFGCRGSSRFIVMRCILAGEGGFLISGISRPPSPKVYWNPPSPTPVHFFADIKCSSPMVKSINRDFIIPILWYIFSCGEGDNSSRQMFFLSAIWSQFRFHLLHD